MKKILRNLLCLISCIFMMVPQTVLAQEEAPSIDIYVVYDDSGSMYENTDLSIVDTWSQAKYSMEVFASMLGPKDSMKIYYMSDYSKNGNRGGARLELSGTDGKKDNIAKVHNERTSSGSTPFDTVKAAYEDLEESDADQKWLVVLTDGVFQMEPGVNDPDAKKLTREMDEYFHAKDPDIQVMFLGMGPEVIPITPDAANDIYFVEAKTNDQILNKVTQISNQIFNTNTLKVDQSGKKFEFDVPVSELTVFAQGKNVKIGDLTGPDGKKISPGEVVEVKHTDKSDNDRHKNNPPIQDLEGKLAYYTGDFKPGTYTASVDGARTVEVYFKPDVKIGIILKDEQGKDVTNTSELPTGNYTVHFGLISPDKNQSNITEADFLPAKVLGDITYQASVENNGNIQEDVQDGDTIEVTEGDFSVDAEAHFLDYNRVQTEIASEILTQKTVTFDFDNREDYELKSNGVSDPQPIIVHMQADGQDPTKEQWDQIEPPAVIIKDAKKFPGLTGTIQKTEEPGIFHLFPDVTKPGGKNFTTAGVELSFEQQISGIDWVGKGSTEFRFHDVRSLFERYRDLIPWLIALLILLIILIGYLPFVKHYLPKRLKDKPTIEGKPLEPGAAKVSVKGRTEKNAFTRFMPYVAQTATVRFAPPTAGGIPRMKIKAVSGRKMVMTNPADFINRPVTFNGEAFDESVRKKKEFKVSLGTQITVKTRAYVYECSLNR